MIDLTALEKAARAATADGEPAPILSYQLVAAANPGTILDLIAMVRERDEMLEEMAEVLEPFARIGDSRAVIRARAILSRYRKARDAEGAK